MTLAYFAIRSAQDKSMGDDEFYQRYPVVQHLYQDVQRWTGLSMDQLLGHDVPEDPDAAKCLFDIRIVLFQLGIHDVLAEEGVQPGAAIGVSLGIVAASAMAGAVSREDAFHILQQIRNIPVDRTDLPPQGVAMVRLARRKNIDYYVKAGGSKVYLAADFGQASDKSVYYILLGGERDALQKLAAKHPEVLIMNAARAEHTPLLQRESDFMRSYLSEIKFSDPRIPFEACLGTDPVREASQVRDAIWQNQVLPARIPHGLARMADEGVRFCVSLGPTQVEAFIGFPFPVIRVSAPDNIPAALAQIRELGY
jgi:[acyl-carrier-protein] S-malonyltransferase